MPRVVLLAGAPEGRNWREEDLTVNKPIPPFSFFDDIEDEHESVHGNVVESKHLHVSTAQQPMWRSIALRDDHLLVGWTQRPSRAGDQLHIEDAVEYEDRHIDLSYLTASETSFGPTGEENDITQFLEQSFALHEDGDQSQLTLPPKTPLTSVLRRTIATKKIEAAADVLALPKLTALSKLPTVATLAHLEPQPVTVDLVCGIISAPAPRSIAIRRTGRVRELVELIAGDETKAGVIVTFWLPESRGPRVVNRVSEEAGLREQVLALRPGHVVCMRNIALRSFKNVVQGQSLGWSTTLQRIDERLRVDAKGQGPESRVAAKIERVRDWTRQFVRPAVAKTVALNGTAMKRGFASFVGEDLPLDETQIDS